MERKFYLIAVAGGSGSRMGAAIPKQFLEIREKAILQRTLEKFISACPGLRVITVLPEAHIPYWKEYCLSRNFSYPQTLVKGGMTRFHSVRNALEKVPDGAIVAVHDGVRPLLSVEMIQRMTRTMDTARALIPVVPNPDTLKALRQVKNADGTMVLERIEGVVLDRSTVFGAQTPQIFRSEDLKEAYTQPFDTAFTDDASVAEKYGIPMEWCLGERLNLKITTPEDIVLAEAVIKNNLK